MAQPEQQQGCSCTTLFITAMFLSGGGAGAFMAAQWGWSRYSWWGAALGGFGGAAVGAVIGMIGATATVAVVGLFCILCLWVGERAEAWKQRRR